MASKIDYLGKIKDIVAKSFVIDADKLTPETDLAKDLGAKSIIIMQIMTAIEDEFGIDLNYMQFNRKKAIGEIVEYVQEVNEN